MNKSFLQILLISIIIIITACSSSRNFKFNAPDIEKYEDIKVQYITTDDNTKLAYRGKGSVKSKTGFVLIPGSTMYSYYYIPLINELSKMNILVRVIDIRGHGDSGGARGDVPSENSLIDDLAFHIRDMKSKNPEMNIIIGGHSMGGGICGRYLEHFGYDSVQGVVYIAPIFHYMQSGMKNPGYVDVSIFNFLFGGDHAVTQIYHPSSNDPKLVKEYTNLMSKSSMVADYSTFRKNHKTKTMFIIGNEDELFDWRDSIKIFDDKNIKYIVLENTGHLNFKLDSSAMKEFKLFIDSI
jgi:pimeloyl-ACP methyl ester carboxylesterase